MALSPETKRAVRRYGPLVNPLARQRYGVSGRTLLSRLVFGESHDDMDAVSSAGARGKAQFIPTTRRAVIDRFGIDPWRSTDEAVHAAALHLTGRLGNTPGLEGYNPGDPGYVDYILGQRPGKVGGPRPRGPAQTDAPGAPPLAQAAGVSPGPDTSGLLASLLGDKPQAAPRAALHAPAFAAQVALPDAYAPVQTAGGPGPKDNRLSQVLEAVSGLGGAPGTQTPSLGPGDAQNGSTTPGRVRGGSVRSVGHGLERWVSEQLGLPLGSGVRSVEDNAKVGGADDSDHLPNPGRWARDFPTTPAAGGWDQYREVTRHLGLRPSKDGFTEGTIRVGKRRFRVQVIFGAAHDHGDHIHVGVRRA